MTITIVVEVETCGGRGEIRSSPLEPDEAFSLAAEYRQTGHKVRGIVSTAFPHAPWQRRFQVCLGIMLEGDVAADVRP